MMSNWVINKFSFKGTEEEIDRIYSQLVTPIEKDGEFRYLMDLDSIFLSENEVKPEEPILQCWRLENIGVDIWWPA